VVLFLVEDATRPTAQRAKAFLDTHTPKAHHVGVRKLSPPACPTSRGSTSRPWLWVIWRVDSLSTSRRCAGITSTSVATWFAFRPDASSSE
jgi:hypothetical protein